MEHGLEVWTELEHTFGRDGEAVDALEAALVRLVRNGRVEQIDGGQAWLTNVS